MFLPHMVYILFPTLSLTHLEGDWILYREPSGKELGFHVIYVRHGPIRSQWRVKLTDKSIFVVNSGTSPPQNLKGKHRTGEHRFSFTEEQGKIKKLEIVCRQ